MGSARLRLGELLVNARLITAEQLAEALEAQKGSGTKIGTLLVQRGLINETELTQILSHQLSVPWVSLLHVEFSRQLLNLVPRELAEQHCMVPIYVRHVRKQGQTLYVALEDPLNDAALKGCSDFSGLPVRAMIAPPADIRDAIRVYYAGGEPHEEEESPSEPPMSRRVDPGRPARRSEHPPVAPSQPPPAPSKPPPAPSKPPAAPSRPPPAPPKPRLEVVADSQPPEAPSVDLHEPDVAGPVTRPSEQPTPPSEPSAAAPIPRPRGGAPKMVSLTLLDGTSITLPKRGTAARAPSLPPMQPEGRHEGGLTARDLVSALRAVSHGADATEILGENVRWEAMFAALLSLLLRKHLIADWEFVEEVRKI